jgi:hypothetical protein
MSKLTQQSSFCKNCKNFMDITNNISSVDSEKNLTGGNNHDNANEIDIEIESSDYDVTMSESIGGAISDTNVSEILNGSDTDLDIKNFNVSDLNKNTTFNKLSNNQKTLVINRILEKMPKNKTKQSDNVASKDSYYYCKSCGYNEIIPSGQFIFSRGDEKNDDFYNYRFKNYIYDNTLPRSKKYNCVNDKCPTHNNPSLKLAVFYRQKNSYNIRYICTVCNGFWNTFVEK